LFKELFKRTNKVPPEERFFSSIHGYSDIKRLLMRAIISRESISILLCGPPASSKTVFLLEIVRGLDNACYIDCTNTTGAGLVDNCLTVLLTTCSWMRLKKFPKKTRMFYSMSLKLAC
jgi:ATP-dependent protease Clp ATPase subunit